MNKTTLRLCIMLMACPTWGLAQKATIGQPDSLAIEYKDSLYMRSAIERFADTRLFKATYLGVPLIIGGLIEKHQDNKFRALRNDFMPSFHRDIDNYTQLAPAIVMLGMKSLGVESRSSWKRMLVSDAFSTLLMTSAVQTLKSATHVTRPDGSNRHSFPSGHTATAFMTATMLNKEYGHLSPWVGIGAYSTATATGLMRMANNKHWLSDVLVGAGIGILSTEMGYWLADVLCKGKGIDTTIERTDAPAYHWERPSFLGLYMGFNNPLSKYDIDDNTAFATSTGTTAGLEGAYFFSRHMGWGGKASCSNLQYIINNTEAPENTFKFYSVSTGPYISLPLSYRWRLGTKLVAGEVFYPHTVIGGLQVDKSHGLTVGTGVSVDYQIQSRCVGSAFIDYQLQSAPSDLSKEYMHVMTLGAKVAVRL